MSETRSIPPQTPLRAATEATARDGAILDVVSLIEGLGLFGLLWLDADFRVRRAHGRIFDFVREGRPADESLPALIGLEAELSALRDQPERIIELPAISFATAEGLTDKFNLTFFWSAQENAIVALAYRSQAQSTLELELSRQIRARLMAEAEATALSRDLARANADLESFAAIISHDLKAPLRHMSQLACAAIEKRLTTEDPDTALVEICAQAERMQHMLSRLFEFSMLGGKYDALEIVDTADLVQSIVKSFPESQIEIILEGEWPHLQTLRAPLDLSIRNLIANARQHHDRDTGLIRVACADSQDALVITISDDGPGVLREHQASIFLPFRTVGDVTDTHSTGMGLAMVDRAVTSVGGAVTIASDPDVERGATFAIQWPKLIEFG